MSGWEVGCAPLGRETSNLPVPLCTHPTSSPAFNYREGRKNYYFRHTFEFDGDPAHTALQISTYLDDGAIFFLNGRELFRHNMPAGVVDDSTWAASAVDNAIVEGP
ncbi:MAG: hypothetical protein GWO24_04630, partial [Akkermansiaceae bacterium]|nr:hypothetical protein [Akkermansiaceae bacterium]